MIRNKLRNTEIIQYKVRSVLSGHVWKYVKMVRMIRRIKVLRQIVKISMLMKMVSQSKAQ